MLIEAVSGVRSNVSYNRVNFEGKKKSNDVTNPQRTSLKAVPLAILIAMSPMANMQAGDKINETIVQTELPESNTKEDVYTKYLQAVNQLLNKQPTKIPKKYQADFANIRRTISLGAFTPVVYVFGENYLPPSRAFLHLTNDEKGFLTFNKEDPYTGKIITYNFQPKETQVQPVVRHFADGKPYTKYRYFIVGEGWEQEMEKQVDSNSGEFVSNGSQPCEEHSEIRLELTEKFAKQLNKMLPYFGVKNTELESDIK